MAIGKGEGMPLVALATPLNTFFRLDPEHDRQRNWGRILGRFIDTYNRPTAIIMAGLRFESLEADGDLGASEVTQECVFKLLLPPL